MKEKYLKSIALLSVIILTALIYLKNNDNLILLSSIGATVIQIITFLVWLRQEDKLPKALDIISSYKKQNENLNNLIYERESQLQQFQKDKQTKETEKRRILDSLKYKKISINKLIEKYNNPLHAILISFLNQKEKNEKNQYDTSHFLTSELKKNYEGKSLGGTEFLIPPVSTPTWIKNSKDLKKWFEEDILKGRFCKIKYISLIDLKNKTFWETYLPFRRKKGRILHHSIGEILNIGDIFTEEQLNKISLSQIIRDGDIGWLSSSYLPEKEYDLILKNQINIEKKLGNPSIRELSDDKKINEIEIVLSSFLTNSNELAKAIVKEAKFWNSKLR